VARGNGPYMKRVRRGQSRLENRARHER
jgi:hypothetical protein